MAATINTHSDSMVSSVFSNPEGMPPPQVKDDMFKSGLSYPHTLCNRWVVRVQPVYLICFNEFYPKSVTPAQFGNKPICPMHKMIHLNCQYMLEAVYITFKSGFLYITTNYKYMRNETILLEPHFNTPEWREVSDHEKFDGLSTMKEASCYIRILNEMINKRAAEKREEPGAKSPGIVTLLRHQATEWGDGKRTSAFKTQPCEQPIKGF